jgi:uncharacterized protein
MTFKKFSFAIILLIAGLSVFAQEFPPKPNTLVNDYTNTLSPDQVNELERKLVAFDDSTSIQIAIAIIQSIGVYDVDEYTVKLAEHWGDPCCLKRPEGKYPNGIWT